MPQTIGGVVLRIGATVELRYGDQPVECGADLTVSKVRWPPAAAASPHNRITHCGACRASAMPALRPSIPTFGRPQTASKPGIDIGQADAEAKYTLVLVDPDAPGGPFLHYIAADIPGDQRQEHRTVVSYKGAFAGCAAVSPPLTPSCDRPFAAARQRQAPLRGVAPAAAGRVPGQRH